MRLFSPITVLEESSPETNVSNSSKEFHLSFVKRTKVSKIPVTHLEKNIYILN